MISESLSLFQALEVRHSDDTEEDYNEQQNAALNNRFEHQSGDLVHSRLAKKRGRKEDALRYLGEFGAFQFVYLFSNLYTSTYCVYC